MESAILVCVPCLNNADNVGKVISTAAEGLVKYFPDQKSGIIVVDGHSSDASRTVAEETVVPDSILKKVVFEGEPAGKGTALLDFIELAKNAGASACATIDADVSSVRPEWIKLLIEPIIAGSDLTSPRYDRSRFEGRVTNHLVYPIFYGVCRTDVRQPIGGDFGFSMKLGRKLLSHPLKDELCVRRYGIDVFISSAANCGQFTVAEAFLGKKIHNVTGVGHISSMFVEVAESLMRCVEFYRREWSVKDTVSSVGAGVPLVDDTPYRKYPPVVGKLVDAFENNVSEKKILLEKTLGRDTILEITSDPLGSFARDRSLWPRATYALCAKYIKSKDKNILEALMSVWLARCASHISEVGDLTDDEAEEKIIGQAREFSKLRPFFLDELGR